MAGYYTLKHETPVRPKKKHLHRLPYSRTTDVSVILLVQPSLAHS